MEMRIGIRTFKILRNGQDLIEAGCREELVLLNSQIHDKCGSQFEINIQQLRNPRII